MQKYLYQDLYDLEDTYWWHKTKRNLVSYFLNQNLKNKKGNKLLDVKCGTGKNLGIFSKFGDVCGVDSSPEAIAFCKERGFKNVTLGNIEKMHFKQNSFDAVTALDVLEHVNDDLALKEINKVLRSNGILVVTVPAFGWIWSKWDEVLLHKRRYTLKILSNILKANEFKIIRISYYYSFLLLPILVIRNIKNIFYKDNYPFRFQIIK